MPLCASGSEEASSTCDALVLGLEGSGKSLLCRRLQSKCKMIELLELLISWHARDCTESPFTKPHAPMAFRFVRERWQQLGGTF